MLKDELLKEMAGFDPAKKGRKRCWNESKQVSKGLDADTIGQKGSVPVQAMLHRSCHYCHQYQCQCYYCHITSLSARRPRHPRIRSDHGL